MSDHALLPPSGSDRWLECAASPAMEHLVGEPDTGSPYARQGTGAHELGSGCLNQRQLSLEPVPVADHLGEKINIGDGGEPIEVDAEMVEAIEGYVEYIEAIPATTRYIEQRVDFSHVVPNGFGMTDCVFETVEKVDGKAVPTLYVIDLKYGMKRVDAYENNQGKLYAIGALNSLSMLLERDIERVVIVIYQPRINNISEFEISVSDLVEWGQSEVKPRADLATGLFNFTKDSRPSADNNGLFDACIKPEMFNPSDKACFYCRARKVCKARAKKVCEAPIDGFSDLTVEEQGNMEEMLPVFKKSPCKNPLVMDNADLAAALKMKSFLTKWIKEVEEVALEKAMVGETIPGFKAIQSLKGRAWKNSEEETEKMLRTAGLKKAEYVVSALISPSVAEKKLKELKKDWKKRFDALSAKAIHRPPGGPKLVSENKPGESIAPTKNGKAIEGFEDNTRSETSQKATSSVEELDLSFLN